MAERLTPAAQRAFLYRAFFPQGIEVCELVGLPSASKDVNIAEFNSAQSDVEEFDRNLMQRAIERSQWVASALSAQWSDIDNVDDDQHLCEGCRSEMVQSAMVGFYVAMKMEEDRGQLVR